MNHCPKCGALVATLPGACPSCGTYVHSASSARLYGNTGGYRPVVAGGPRGARGGINAIITVVVIFAAVVSGLIILQHRGIASDNGGGGPSPTPAPPGPPLNVPVSDGGNRFTVKFPGNATQLSAPVTVQGTAVSLEEYSVQVSKAVGYTAGVVTLPATVDVTAPSGFLDQSASAVAAAEGGTVVFKNATTHQNLPAIDYVTSVGGGFIAHRNVLAGHQLVEIAVSGPDDPPIGFDAFAASLLVSH